MLGLYSRYIVGWMIAEHESARKARHFIRETVHNHIKGGSDLNLKAALVAQTEMESSIGNPEALHSTGILP